MKVLVLSMVLLPVIVNAGSIGKPEKQSLAKLIEKTKATGKGQTITNMAEVLKVERGTPAREIEILELGATDGIRHSFDVLFKVETPISLVFLAQVQKGNDAEAYNYVCDLEGNLKTVLRHSFKYDGSGKVVKGSGQIVTAEITSKEVQKRFQHELDFWLKGKYRKPAKDVKAAK